MSEQESNENFEETKAETTETSEAPSPQPAMDDPSPQMCWAPSPPMGPQMCWAPTTATTAEPVPKESTGS